jgi:hypothetical protein
LLFSAWQCKHCLIGRTHTPQVHGFATTGAHNLPLWQRARPHADPKGARVCHHGCTQLATCLPSLLAHLSARLPGPASTAGWSSGALRMTTRPTAAKAAGGPPPMAPVKREDAPGLDSMEVVTPARKRLRFGTPTQAGPEAGLFVVVFLLGSVFFSNWR